LVEPAASDLVVLGAAIVVGGAPARFDPAAPLEPVQGRVERSLSNVQRGAGDLMQPLGNRPPMLGPERHGLEDQQVERALRQIDAVIGHDGSPRASTKKPPGLLSKRKGAARRLVVSL